MNALTRQISTADQYITPLKMYFGVRDGVYSKLATTAFSEVKRESRESRVAGITCRPRRGDLSD